MLDNRDAWLLIHHAPGIGSRTFLKLLERFDTPERVLAASREQLRETGVPVRAIDFLRQAGQDAIRTSLDWLARAGADLLTLHDPRYPQLLRQIHDPPPVLYILGDPTLLDLPLLAIVGSRNPTPTGESNAQEFAACLAGAGMGIVSGLAIGIDGAAHQGALQRGKTVAVAGTGLDRVYPARHKELAHRIASQGILISEYLPGTQPRVENFPRRNRIISGLSLGVLVVEATLRSGSLITARLALEQGREVFAIPGSIHNPQARGCHALIREGAKLVESAQDIMVELGALLGGLSWSSENTGPSGGAADGQNDSEHRHLLEAMGYDPISIDQLIERTGLTAESVSSMLLVLELDGHVSSAPGGYYTRRGK